MAGTREGGLKTVATLRGRDPDYYKKIGAKGGKVGRTGGFGAGEEGRKRASYWGAIGGRRSRRSSKKGGGYV